MCTAWSFTAMDSTATSVIDGSSNSFSRSTTSSTVELSATPHRSGSKPGNFPGAYLPTTVTQSAWSTEIEPEPEFRQHTRLVEGLGVFDQTAVQ